MIDLSICHKSVQSLSKTELPKIFYSTFSKLDLFFWRRFRKSFVVALKAPLFGNNNPCVTSLWGALKDQNVIKSWKLVVGRKLGVRDNFLGHMQKPNTNFFHCKPISFCTNHDSW